MAHTRIVRGVVTWEGRAISGSDDNKISVHDIVTLRHEATLDHSDAVLALAVTGGRLYSTGSEGIISVWALGTFQLVHRVRLPDVESSWRLAVSGSKLLCGVHASKSSRSYNGCRSVVVLGTETMHCEYTLRVDLDKKGCCTLLSHRGKVWGTVGEPITGGNVVVWEAGMSEPEAGRA